MNSTMTEASTNSLSFIWIVDRFEMYIFSIYVLLGLPIHSYVLWIIITGSAVASGFFNLNLSCCEICICVDFIFFILSNFISSLFPLAFFFQGLSITGRPVFQCLMCVERYLAVVHPVTFLKFKPLRYRVICCSVVWMITLGSCLVCVIIYLLSTTTVYAWFFLMQFLVFLSIQLFCLVAVLRALKQSGPGERREREEENHMKRRAFYLILIMTVTLVITYVPLTISAFFIILGHQYSLSLWYLSIVCYVLASFVQPGLYLHQAGKMFCLCSPQHL